MPTTTYLDCDYCGGEHAPDTHGDALVTREHYRRDGAELVECMLDDARALLESLPRGPERDAGLGALAHAEAMHEATSAYDYLGELGPEITRENLEAVDGALWAGGFVPVWDAGDYWVLPSVADDQDDRD